MFVRKRTDGAPSYSISDRYGRVEFAGCISLST